MLQNLSSGRCEYMNRVILIVMVMCSFTMPSLAQEQQSCLVKSDVLINKTKPTVYITFERLENQNVLLRIHNNTRWAIHFSTESLYITQTTPLKLCGNRGAQGLNDGRRVNLIYQVEAERGFETVHIGNRIETRPIVVTVPPLSWGDVSSTSWLPSGRSAIFLVERRYLAKNLKIYVPFVYEWETAERDSGDNNLEHRVYFRSYDLSEGLGQN